MWKEKVKYNKSVLRGGGVEICIGSIIEPVALSGCAVEVEKDRVVGFGGPIEEVPIFFWGNSLNFFTRYVHADRELLNGR